MNLCDWSDLPTQECQHCKDGKKVIGNASRGRFGDENSTYSGRSHTFSAGFPGHCAGCGQTIQVGQDIYMLNGQARHEGE